MAHHWLVLLCVYITYTRIPFSVSMILDLDSLGYNDPDRGFDGSTCRSLTPILFYFLQVTPEAIDASLRDEE